MLSFTACFDLRKEHERFLRSESARRNADTDQSGSVSPSSENGVTAVGQERDGAVIFTWNSVSTLTKGAKGQDCLVTHVGIYDPSKQLSKVIFVHERVIPIVGASVNQERTLLAFVTLDTVEPWTESSSYQPKGTYKVFLAEIQPQNSVYNLNLERTNFIKVQFLYGRFKGFGESAEKETHLVVFLHKEAVGLYHIPLARMGDKGVIMSGQPKTEKLFSRFVWAQWDGQYQRMHLIHTKKIAKGNQDHVQATLTIRQFNTQSKTAFEFMLEVPLDIPIPDLKQNSSSTYIDQRLSNTVQDANINMMMLTFTNGTLCLCYQHPGNLSRLHKHGKNVKQSNNQSTLDDALSLHYTVSLLHHNTMLRCSIPNFTKEALKKAKIAFGVVSDYALVYLPGRFVHLLNISSEFEPCHHILLHEDTPAVDTPPSMNPLSQFFKERSTSFSNAGSLFYSSVDKKAYKVSVNKDYVVDMFTQCYMPTTRAALLHYTVLRAKDVNMVHQLFRVLCNDVASPEIQHLFEEFLVASTYSVMRRQLERDQLKLFPFTDSDTGRGQLEKTREGDRLAQISFTPMKHTINVLKRKNVTVHSMDDLLENFQRHVRLKLGLGLQRFRTRRIHKYLEEMDKASESDSNKAKNLQKKTSQTNILSRLSMKAKQAFSPQVDSTQSSSTTSSTRLPASDSDQGDLPQSMKHGKWDEHEENKMEVVVDQLGHHVARFMKQNVKGKIHNLATEYVSSQESQSKQLFHVLWCLLGVEEPYMSLSIPGSLQDYELFQLLERYYITVEELAFPLVPGFHTFFTSLGFRCLDFHLFLQYVDQGVLHVTSQFVSQLLEDLNDSHENAFIKFQVISKMVQREAVQFFQKWNHPICRKYVAEQLVASKILESSNSSSVQHSDSMSSGSGYSFPPLVTLMKLLEDKDKSLNQSSSSPDNLPAADSQFLEETALLYSTESFGRAAAL